MSRKTDKGGSRTASKSIKDSEQIVVSDAIVINKIHVIRGEQVMLDNDLAELYGVETKYLKRQVRRNIKRFPEDFMFELNKNEFENLRCQFGTSSWGGTRYFPMAFTEIGIPQLSTVLNSNRAIMVNLQIMRVFAKMRRILLTHKDLFLRLEQLERKLIGQDKKIELVFKYLKQFIKEQEQPRKQIGFKTGKDKK